MNNNFKNETLGTMCKTPEKVHYKGELRLIGMVVNRLTDKDPIGYVIMVEKTKQFKMYTVEQTKVLLDRFKFVNAALENGNIVNTECSMTRVPKFNTNMQVIGNHGIIILGEIVENGKKIGYRAMDTNAKIVDIEEHEIVKLNNNGVDIINAKIVRRDNKDIISAIKSEFTKIEKSKLEEITPKRVSKTQRWRYDKHVNKILKYSASIIMTQIFTCRDIRNVNFSDNWAWRESEDMYGRWMEPLKEYRIFCKEVATEENNCIISDRDKEILKAVNDLPRQNKFNYVKEMATDETKWFMVTFLQIALNNKHVYERTIEKIKKRRYNIKLNLAKELVEKGLACDSFKRLTAEVKDIYREAKELREETSKNNRKIYKSDEKHEFKTKTFTTGKEMAQLGFTISEDNRNIEYVTDYGYNKTLLYLGDIIGSGSKYNNYRNASRCLGDLISIAYIEKLLQKLENGYTYIDEEDMIVSIQMIICIAYMFNSEAMKMYVKDNERSIERYLGELPKYEEIAGIDYKLNNWLTMYYSSGFNVFLSDDNVYEYKHSHLANAELINYRQLGVKHDIQHKMLQDEFASVVSLITPSTVSGESVTRLIGKLRFL